MQILHLISVTVWSLIAYHAFIAFRSLKDQGMSKREVTALTILLLSGLNITRGLIAAVLNLPPRMYTGQVLLEYFNIGALVFQIMLCAAVLKYIKTNKK